MRALLTTAFLVASLTAGLAATAPQTPPQTTAPPKPVLQPVETISRQSASTTLTVQATDGLGAALAGVDVRVAGPVTREGKTGDDGSVRFQRVPAGSFRLRFTREGFVTLERDVTVRPGQPLKIDATLSAAPPAPPPQPCPEPARPVAAEPAARGASGPVGEAQTTAVPTFIESNFIGRAPRKDSRLGCAASGTGTLVQMREAITEQAFDASDVWLYVVAGEGLLRVNDKEEKLAAGTFSLVPRTMRHSILPRGKNPLMLIVIEAGRACEGIGSEK